jgi:hypothetical protein
VRASVRECKCACVLACIECVCECVQGVHVCVRTCVCAYVHVVYYRLVEWCAVRVPVVISAESSPPPESGARNVHCHYRDAIDGRAADRYNNVYMYDD